MTLYHFTDPFNLVSSRRHGLLSWKQLIARGIKHQPASDQLSRQLDTGKDLEDFIHLCIAPHHRMVYYALSRGRIADVAWLEIDDSVTDLKSTLYSSDNAASSRATFSHDYRTAFESDSDQAEVLVKRRIPPDKIKLVRRRASRPVSRTCQRFSFSTE